MADSLAMLVFAWMRSLRFELEGESRSILADLEHPAIHLLWHNRLMAAPEVHRRFLGRHPLTVLISASRDGAWLARLFQRAGIRASRGSSSRRALAATRAMLNAVRGGSDLGVTPDGPRGPCYSVKPGLARAIAITRRPAVIMMPEFLRARRLDSWDGFYLPGFGSRVRLRVRRIEADDPNLRLPDAEGAAWLRQRMMEMTRESLADPARLRRS